MIGPPGIMDGENTGLLGKPVGEVRRVRSGALLTDDVGDGTASGQPSVESTCRQSTAVDKRPDGLDQLTRASYRPEHDIMMTG